MVQAWYVDALGEVPNEEQIHFLNSAEVELLTGVECIQVDPSDSVKIARIKKERDVPQEKVVLFSKESFPNFDEQRKFFTEHFHTKEEIRLVLDGSGYFDVRDISDRWIRHQ